ncbi:hypothetical protein PSTG_13523 [Puccinia striiformis f. sp. tritici PST-78]|uniref:FMN-dependent dehydrogenase domain-containing protein n=1 Tax=Puccinia striiformis f. sp. tritici PST-78 TaxID=1165861 RepID=A0A0L0V2D1_9BASI|nr:hypothetical protein PSTG_13523 [Puccinia striiformis f. sp. tritici PST-78]
MVISNHGGQQLDYSLSAQEILISIVSELKSRKMYNLQEFAIFVDGGICRSSNIIKALCCGASALMGATIYSDRQLQPLVRHPDPRTAQTSWSKQSVHAVHHGVVKAIQILKDEMEMNMRLS